jgi:hypothetical protein
VIALILVLSAMAVVGIVLVIRTELMHAAQLAEQRVDRWLSPRPHDQ